MSAVRLGFFLVLLFASPALAQTEARAPEGTTRGPSTIELRARMEELAAHATPEERALLEQASLLLDASGDPLRDPAAQARAGRIAETALTLIAARRRARAAELGVTEAEGARQRAMIRRDEARRREEAAAADAARRATASEAGAPAP